MHTRLWDCGCGARILRTASKLCFHLSFAWNTLTINLSPTVLSVRNTLMWFARLMNESETYNYLREDKKSWYCNSTELSIKNHVPIFERIFSSLSQSPPKSSTPSSVASKLSLNIGDTGWSTLRERHSDWNLAVVNWWDVLKLPKLFLLQDPCYTDVWIMPFHLYIRRV